MTVIHTLAKKHHAAVIELRRHLHAHPELSHQEFQTQKRVMEELAALGLTSRPIANTGVVAEIKGGKSGKTVAVRADMDALQLVDECGKPYQSENHGVCHACGHDGHTAMLIGVAKILVDMKENLAGTIRLLFQPGEESFPGGAEQMIKEGAVDGVDAIIGAHLWQPVPSGAIGVSYDRLMASPDEFTIRIKGRGGHGSMPQQTVDAALVAAQVVVSLNTIVSRNIDPLEQAVLSVGMLKSGETFNIIPDSAEIKGTVRSFEHSIRLGVFNRMEEMLKGICAAHGAEYQLDTIFGYPPVINRPEYTKVIAEAGESALGKENVLTIKPVMGGEDFSYYLEKVPGAFFFVGAGNEEKGAIYPQHHPKYDIDEDALRNGMEVMAAAAVKLAEG